MSSTPLRFLFIKLKHFGDVLLLTPVLAATRQAYPGCHITVLVREGTGHILSKDIVDEILSTVPPEKDRRSLASMHQQLDLLRRLRQQPFDMVFELTDGDRGRWLGLFSRARLRCTSSYGWQPGWFWRVFYQGLHEENWNLCHRVEKDYRLVRRFLPLLPDVPPPLVMPEELAAFPVAGPYVVLHPASRWRRKLWPVERWADVGRFLVSRGLECVVSSGPDPEETASAAELCRLIGDKAIPTNGQLSWGQLSSLICGASLFVGIDTAAMHLAAACQTPVVALFGPSIEHQWHPWKSRHEIVTPPASSDCVPPDPIYDALNRSMLDIAGQDVIAACERMLSPSS